MSSETTHLIQSPLHEMKSWLYKQHRDYFVDNNIQYVDCLSKKSVIGLLLVLMC